MAKDIQIESTGGCIRYKGVDYVPASGPFACEAGEAKRLIGMGVAAESFKPTPPANNKKLLAAIAKAATIEELQALMPEEEPAEEVTAAFQARRDILESDPEN